MSEDRSADGRNLYSYAGESPTSLIDPNGRERTGLSLLAGSFIMLGLMFAELAIASYSIALLGSVTGDAAIAVAVSIRLCKLAVLSFTIALAGTGSSEVVEKLFAAGGIAIEGLIHLVTEGLKEAAVGEEMPYCQQVVGLTFAYTCAVAGAIILSDLD